MQPLTGSLDPILIRPAFKIKAVIFGLDPGLLGGLEHGAGYITFCLDTMKSTILSVRAPLRRCCTHVLTCSADLRERSKLVDPRNKFSSLSLRACPQNLIVIVFYVRLFLLQQTWSVVQGSSKGRCREYNHKVGGIDG